MTFLPKILQFSSKKSKQTSEQTLRITELKKEIVHKIQEIERKNQEIVHKNQEITLKNQEIVNITYEVESCRKENINLKNRVISLAKSNKERQVQLEESIKVRANLNKEYSSLRKTLIIIEAEHMNDIAGNTLIDFNLSNTVLNLFESLKEEFGKAKILYSLKKLNFEFDDVKKKMKIVKAETFGISQLTEIKKKQFWEFKLISEIMKQTIEIFEKEQPYQSLIKYSLVSFNNKKAQYFEFLKENSGFKMYFKNQVKIRGEECFKDQNILNTLDSKLDLILEFLLLMLLFSSEVELRFTSFKSNSINTDEMRIQRSFFKQDSNKEKNYFSICPGLYDVVNKKILEKEMKTEEPNIVLGKNAKVPIKRIDSDDKYEVYSSSPRIVYIMPNSKTNIYINIKANIANSICDEIIIKDIYNIEYVSDLVIGKICKNAFEYTYIKVFNFTDYGYAVKPGDKIALVEIDPSSVENIQNTKCYNY